MKTFKFPQNKWVMTATLAAVLGLNVSINYQPSQVEAAEFASTAGAVIESEVLTADGPLSVRYLNNKTHILAIVPQKTTEGKICDDCYQTITLQTTNKEDIKELNIQLLKALRDKEAAAAKVVAAPAKAAVEKEESAPAKKDPFASIEKACERKKENADFLSCTSDRFISLLRKNGSKIDKDEALDFFRDHIESSIKSELKKVDGNVNTAISAWTSSYSKDFILALNNVSEPKEAIYNASQINTNTLKIVRDLIADIPSKFENVRERLLEFESEMAREKARKIEQAFIQSKRLEGSMNKDTLNLERDLRYNDFKSLLDNMYTHTNEGLYQATSTGDLNANLYRQYQSRINTILQELNASIEKQRAEIWNNSFMPGTTTGATTPNLGARLANPGRNTNGQTNGTINRSQIGPDLSQRLGNRVQSPAMGMRGRQ